MWLSGSDFPAPKYNAKLLNWFQFPVSLCGENVVKYISLLMILAGLVIVRFISDLFLTYYLTYLVGELPVSISGRANTFYDSFGF